MTYHVGDPGHVEHHNALDASDAQTADDIATLNGQVAALDVRVTDVEGFRPSLDDLTDVSAPSNTPARKVLGTTGVGAWGPMTLPPPEYEVSADAGQQAVLGTDGLLLVTGLAEDDDPRLDQAQNIATVQKDPTGIPVASALSISIDDGTRVVTVAPTSGSYAYWYFGTEVTVSTSKTVTIPDTAGVHYIYFDDTSGTLRQSMTPWDISSTVQVAAVFWDAVNNKSLLIEERHGVSMSWSTHLRLHAVEGTKVVSGFGDSNWSPNVASDAATTPDIASGVIADEDLRTTVAALTAGTGAYKVWYRMSGSGDWTWEASDFPFLFTVGSYVQYNNPSGWGMTVGSNNRWVNYYALAIPALTTGMGIMWVAGQTLHTTLAAAQQESFASLSLGSLPVTEFAALYRVTLSLSSGDSNTGKCRIASMTRIVGSTTVVNATGVNVHSGLAGLTDANAHPASSISADTASFGSVLSAADTTVQAALDSIDNAAAPLASPALTGTPTAPTAAADTNSTQIATTAYVVGQAGTATPVIDGTAAVGTSLRYARDDHVHPAPGAWTSWAPTLTASSVNPTLSNNSSHVLASHYITVGKTVTMRFNIQFGNAGVSAGTGQYRVSLPVTTATDPVLSGMGPPCGFGFIYDSSATQVTVCVFRPVSNGTYTEIYVPAASNAFVVGAAVPWTWAAGDIISGTLIYEAA